VLHLDIENLETFIAMKLNYLYEHNNILLIQNKQQIYVDTNLVRKSKISNSNSIILCAEK
jgi:hypothetical protein